MAPTCTPENLELGLSNTNDCEAVANKDLLEIKRVKEARLVLNKKSRRLVGFAIFFSLSLSFEIRYF